MRAKMTEPTVGTAKTMEFDSFESYTEYIKEQSRHLMSVDIQMVQWNHYSDGFNQIGAFINEGMTGFVGSATAAIPIKLSKQDHGDVKYVALSWITPGGNKALVLADMSAEVPFTKVFASTGTGPWYTTSYQFPKLIDAVNAVLNNEI